MFLAIDKPQWITSYDVIRVLKNKFPKGTKIGHSGTLDPMATGLLIIAIDKDTKRLGEFLWSDKSYVTTIDFSKMSDTWDMDYWEYYEEYELSAPNVTSNIVRSIENKDHISRPPTTGRDRSSSKWQRQWIIKNTTFIPAPMIEEIRAKLDMLIPSAMLPLTPFSAKKKDGKKFYERARAGEIINETREMTVRSYEIISYDFPLLQLKLDVWSGTYIRSLGYRLGQEFDLGGILTSLRRTKVGDIDIHALTLDQCIENIHYAELLV